MRQGKYSLRSMSTRSNKTRLVYTDKNGREINLGVFPNGSAAERKMIAHSNMQEKSR